MAPKAHHIHETSQPLNRATQWDRDTQEDPGQMACLDHQAPGQTGLEGANGPPESGAEMAHEDYPGPTQRQWWQDKRITHRQQGGGTGL